MIWGLHVFDIIAIIAYFSVTIWIGFRAAKKVKSQEDYFLAGGASGNGFKLLRLLVKGLARSPS